MSARLVTPDEYLRGELASTIKHEYVGGVVYAMAGARNQHNEVAGNVFAALHARLRGKPCRPFNSDTKVRIRLPNETPFHYPDAQVTCQRNAPNETFQDHPSVVIEVLSDGTRRVDEGEKREAYLSLPSVDAYLLIESDSALVVAFRRTDAGFVREVHAGLDGVVSLPTIGIELALAEVYEGVQLSGDDADVRQRAREFGNATRAARWAVRRVWTAAPRVGNSKNGPRYFQSWDSGSPTPRIYAPSRRRFLSAWGSVSALPTPLREGRRPTGGIPGVPRRIPDLEIGRPGCSREIPGSEPRIPGAFRSVTSPEKRKRSPLELPSLHA
jgi:Uma2 family endonuclease